MADNYFLLNCVFYDLTVLKTILNLCDSIHRKKRRKVFFHFIYNKKTLSSKSLVRSSRIRQGHYNICINEILFYACAYLHINIFEIIRVDVHIDLTII